MLDATDWVLVSLARRRDVLARGVLGDRCEERGFPVQSLVVGKAYFIRTLVWYYTGRVVAITPTDVTLEDAACIPDQGRMWDALSTGNLTEVEPFVDPVHVSLAILVDATAWPHPLPRKQI